MDNEMIGFHISMLVSLGIGLVMYVVTRIRKEREREREMERRQAELHQRINQILEDLQTPRMYILDGRNQVVPVLDVMAHAAWMAKAHQENRTTVRRTQVRGYEIVTSFLGLDASMGHFEEPDVFETMVFGEPEIGYQVRCSTWERAVRNHERAVDSVRQRIGEEIAPAEVERLVELLRAGVMKPDEARREILRMLEDLGDLSEPPQEPRLRNIKIQNSEKKD